MDMIAKIKSYTFTGQTEQEAYIKGCKQLAKYMASKKYSNISVKIRRVKVLGSEAAFEFSLYTNIDAKAEQARVCSMCKEYNRLFYINQERDCAKCQMKQFLQRMQKRASISKSFYRKQIK